MTWLVVGLLECNVFSFANKQKPIEGALDDVCNLMPSTIKTEVKPSAQADPQ